MYVHGLGHVTKAGKVKRRVKRRVPKSYNVHPSDLVVHGSGGVAVIMSRRRRALRLKRHRRSH